MAEPAVHDSLDTAAVAGWLATRSPGVAPPLRAELITGGHSNLTYRLTDAAGRRLVLRRPPHGDLLPTAHDMPREHRILAGLADTAVPTPPVVALCTDRAVIGTPFYVMQFVDGVVPHSLGDADRTIPYEERCAVAHSLVDSLAALHEVDVDAVGLGDLSRRDGFVERQLKRWLAQFHRTTPDAGLVDEVHDLLAAGIPVSTQAALVHGDYRLGNCIVSDARVAAVVDWELATLGDPLADVGYVMATWVESGEVSPHTQPSPSALPGFPSRAELLGRYAQRSGRDVRAVSFYTGLAFWRLACIAEGVRARYVERRGQHDDEAKRFAESVDRRLLAARAALTDDEGDRP